MRKGFALRLPQMRKGFALFLVAALLGTALLGVGLLVPPSAPAQTTTIRLGDNFFNPSFKRVKRGTLVRFRWVGRNRHNVVKRSGPGRHFASRTTRKRGINYQRRFRKAGRYRIYCTVHPRRMNLTLRARR